MKLQQGTLLQGGKYKIEKILGQGGFGITYLAMQDILDRKVAIKEFFIKEYCDRDIDSRTVTINTQSNNVTVEKYLNKFIKEAKTISDLHHPNIIQIYDVFRENNTAYYVMEYIEGKSLGQVVNNEGALPEEVAVRYIRKTAEALSYIHKKHINHLDIKPNNIMLRDRDQEIILIDFGVAKQYNESTNQGTTTTPVCISIGYSPMEQYKRNGVSSFSPESDIYSLGATLYKLVTGNTPPEAIDVVQNGLPRLPETLAENYCKTILRSMQANKNDRPQNIEQFLDLLSIAEPIVEIEKTDEDVTIVSEPEIVSECSSSNQPASNIKSNHQLYIGISLLVCLFFTFILLKKCNKREDPSPDNQGSSDLLEEVNNYPIIGEGGILLYYWTGLLDEEKKPIARGTAIYPLSDIDKRKSYVGEMKNGLRSGDNDTLTYVDGNVYIGSFKDDNLLQGRLQLDSDSVYYIGSFENNEPYNGKWYCLSGEIYSSVINGKELAE